LNQIDDKVSDGWQWFGDLDQIRNLRCLSDLNLVGWAEISGRQDYACTYKFFVGETFFFPSLLWNADNSSPA